MSDLGSQLRAYVEATIERIDIDDVAASASTGAPASPKPTLPKPVWVVAGAALAVILLVGIPLLLVGSGDSINAGQIPTTAPANTVSPPNRDAVGTQDGLGDVADSTDTPPSTATPITSTTVPSEEPIEVFTFADDDLCEWVAADRITVFFSEAYEFPVDDWDAMADLQHLSDLEPDECWWRLATTTDDDSFAVHAWNANPGVVLLPAEIVEYDGRGVGFPGPAVSGHPALSEGVVVQNAGWDIYTFWVPPSDNYLALSISRATHTTELPTGQEQIERQARFFSFTVSCSEGSASCIAWRPFSSGVMRKI